MGFLEKVFGNYSQKEIKRLQPTVNKVLALENEFAAMSDAQLRGMTDKLKARLANGETLDDILPEGFCHLSGSQLACAGNEAFPGSDPGFAGAASGTHCGNEDR